VIGLLLGNVVEWRMPEDIDLEGVEFKAMTSGSHTLKTDFVYVQLCYVILIMLVQYKHNTRKLFHYVV